MRIISCIMLNGGWPATPHLQQHMTRLACRHLPPPTPKLTGQAVRREAHCLPFLDLQQG
ncbi:hypothetical protein [Candidatus Regiella endosymbiont of Tuberolachnus salignus]|uniref:hypothetical protein n=1 Tax=Candidatus Regiella endosymbiont of Tuberolachnus salignus TaxID=3077956 RepID=UPI0030D60E1F